MNFVTLYLSIHINNANKYQVIPPINQANNRNQGSDRMQPLRLQAFTDFSNLT